MKGFFMPNFNCCLFSSRFNYEKKKKTCKKEIQKRKIRQGIGHAAGNDGQRERSGKCPQESGKKMAGHKLL